VQTTKRQAAISSRVSRKALTQLKFDVRGPTDVRGIICKTPRTSRGDSRKPSLQIREFLSLLWQRRTSVREAKSDRHRSRGLHYSKGVGVLHSAALLDSRKLTGEKQPSVEGSPISSSFLRQVHGDPLPSMLSSAAVIAFDFHHRIISAVQRIENTLGYYRESTDEYCDISRVNHIISDISNIKLALNSFLKILSWLNFPMHICLTHRSLGFGAYLNLESGNMFRLIL